MSNVSVTNGNVVARYWSLVLGHWSFEDDQVRLLIVSHRVAIDTAREVGEHRRGHRGAEHLRTAVAQQNRHDTWVPASELIAVDVVLRERQRRVGPADSTDG